MARTQAQVHQGSRYGAFDDHEHAVQDDGGRDGQERAEIRPARVTGVEHAVDERAGGGGDGHRVQHVEAPGGAVGVARWHDGMAASRATPTGTLMKKTQRQPGRW
jgi:hypothetical protein